MEKNKKILVSDEIANFIKSYNADFIISDKTGKRTALYWNECKYISTKDVNVFEVIFPNNIHSELLFNRLDNE